MRGGGWAKNLEAVDEGERLAAEAREEEEEVRAGAARAWAFSCSSKRNARAFDGHGLNEECARKKRERGRVKSRVRNSNREGVTVGVTLRGRYG